MHRGGDRSGGPSSGGDRSGARFQRGPSRWSGSSGGGLGGSPPNRYSSRGAADGGGGGGGGGRFHPYRGSSDYSSGGGGYRGGSGVGNDFGDQRQRYGGGTRGGGRGDFQDHDSRSNYVKLFVGSVPRTATEEDVRPLFEEHGDVLEVALIKDRKTGEQQGAIEHKLFVASLNKQATPKEIEEIFAPYGHVEDVYIMRDSVKQSRGCGFVKFSSKEAAVEAMNALSGTYTMRGCEQPLIIRFADPKRPRPGESRPTANLDESRGQHMLPESWRPSSPRPMAPNQYNNFGSDNPLALSGGTVTSADNGMNTPMVQEHHLRGQQIPSLQKPPGPPQNFAVQLQNAQPGQPLQGHIPQIGQLQAPQSTGPVSFGQNISSMQLPGQPPASQPLMQRNASLGALHAPPSGQSNPMQAVPGQQQLPTSVAPQMLQQSMQQMPSQAPQLLLQQQAALQSSYQSSQQAIYQLQQQLQLMQQQSNLNQQPSAQLKCIKSFYVILHFQSGQPVQSSNTGDPGAIIPTKINAISQQVGSSAVSSTCNWTEHTSPEGFKYYYNSITRESKWEKPEEYVLYEQQQQKLLLLQQHQQNIAVQQLQSPPQGQSLPSMQPIQQLPQAQGQTQMHMKQQELNYSQFQAAGSIDPNRIQQGIPAAQERAWKN
ncbi:Flowering time control protein FCA [Zea mays]|uniref:Flowering time control protein FCA n=1 Tax=Zea mays TaxID=4577 RepID=A0A3L6FVJ2_MAIZE|nr:Flowering time control protein FCA [Zea mays]